MSNEEKNVPGGSGVVSHVDNNGTSQTANTGGLPTANTGDVSKVDQQRVKLPDFVEEYTELWFWQVECAFDAANISADKKKYNHIIGQLPTRLMYKLADLRTHPPPTGQMFETLKARIIKEFADSTSTKLTKLMGELTLGDRKPSQLLAEMRSKASDTPVTDELLKELWLRNLPSQIRAIISADDQMTLVTAATMADRIMESTRSANQQVHAVQSTLSAPFSTKTSSAAPIEKLQRQIEELTRQMSQLQSSQSRSRSVSRNNNHRSQTPSNNDASNDTQQRKHDTCWWHFKFGAAARKCKPPCNFNQQQSSQQSVSGN